MNNTLCTLDEINRAVCSTYARPDYAENGFRFWFRGYVPSPDNPLLIGAALAWPEDRSPDAITYYAIAGSPEVDSLIRGESFKLEPTPSITHETIESGGMASLVNGKTEAMERLRAYVSSVVGKISCLEPDMGGGDPACRQR